MGLWKRVDELETAVFGMWEEYKQERSGRGVQGMVKTLTERVDAIEKEVFNTSQQGDYGDILKLFWFADSSPKRSTPASNEHRLGVLEKKFAGLMAAMGDKELVEVTVTEKNGSEHTEVRWELRDKKKDNEEGEGQ